MTQRSAARAATTNRNSGRHAGPHEGTESSGQGPRELSVTRGDVSLCFLVNRRAKTMRVVDFRSGSQPEKLEIVREVARAEGAERAFTVVEREEASAWGRLGFNKEGSIPGFYKRSDAYLLGTSIEDAVRESGTRIKVAPPNGSTQGVSDGVERAYQAARRQVRARRGEPLPTVKVTRARDQDVERAFEVARSTGRDLTDFEPFGRDTLRDAYLLTARGGFSVLVGVETQPCFDNACLELLTGPRGDKETWMIAGGLNQLCDELAESGIVSVFALSPGELQEMSALLVAAGFRKTGRLPGHLCVGGRPTDALLWSRKLLDVG